MPSSTNENCSSSLEVAAGTASSGTVPEVLTSARMWIQPELTWNDSWSANSCRGRLGNHLAIRAS